MTKSILYSLVVALLLAVSTPSMAGDVSVHVSFSVGEASIIRSYYLNHALPKMSKGNGMGKGNNKGSKGLPPGIAKNLMRGKPLPPGIAKQVLPAGLIQLLPPPPLGYERISLAGKILLVHKATHKIHDVIEDAIFGK